MMMISLTVLMEVKKENKKDLAEYIKRTKGY